MILNSIMSISVGAYFFFNKMKQKHGEIFQVRQKLEHRHNTLSGMIISKQHIATANASTVRHVTS